MTLRHEAYLAVIREESERFLTALAGTGAQTPVPTCAGWTAAEDRKSVV